MFFAITQSEYKRNILKIHKSLIKLNKNYQRDFIDLLYSHLKDEEKQKVKLHYQNFMRGKAHNQCAYPPNYFWFKTQMYHYFLLMNNINMEDLIGVIQNLLEKAGEITETTENLTELKDIDLKQGKVRLHITVED